MNITLIYAHPYKKSFNHAIQKVVTTSLSNNHTINLIDLNKDNFNPVLTEKELSVYSQGKYLDPLVGQYQKIIKESDHLIFIFPVWWTIMPAILKGFFDKVLLKDFAFNKDGKIPKGLLTNIAGATIITTMSSPSIYYNLLIKNPLKGVLINGTLKFCGIKKTKWFKIGMVDQISLQKREHWLEKIALYCKKL